MGLPERLRARSPSSGRFGLGGLFAEYARLYAAINTGIESGTHQAKEPELRSLAKLYQTSVNFLTGHDQLELQWESFPELYQATTDLVAADRDEVLRFVRFLHSRDSDASK